MRPLAAALLAFLPACTFLDGDPSVLVTSTPPGAEILVDGQPTGKTTPALLELDGFFGDHHVITLRKRGFSDEERQVTHYRQLYGSRWIDGAAAIEVWSFPFFWTAGDVVTPFAIKWRYVPHEVHARLYREGQAPLREDPASQAAPEGAAGARE
ncbi:MAG: PEGA domain-containing protein [Planctomycetes bacterium]|nr:PEGA domain-containing protein [Planctomycetota bacterium]